MMVMEMNKITSNCSQDNSENNTQFVFLLVLKHLNSEDKAKKPENIEISNFRVFFRVAEGAFERQSSVRCVTITYPAQKS